MMKNNTGITPFTPLEKAADFNRRSSPIEADGGIKPPSAQTVRERSSLTGFTAAVGGAGFTFLELIVAVTIFAVTAVAIYSSFGVGITASRKAEESYKVRQEARHLFSVFSRDLREAVNFTLLVDPKVQSDSKDSFKGSTDWVTFWRSLRIKGEESKRIIKLTYYIKNDGIGPDGKETKSVYRKLQTYEDIVKDEEGAGVESALVSDISDFALEYLYYAGEEVVWEKEWKKKDAIAVCTLPFAVKVSLTYLPADNKTVEFSKTIVIPTGTLNEKTGNAP